MSVVFHVLILSICILSLHLKNLHSPSLSSTQSQRDSILVTLSPSTIARSQSSPSRYVSDRNTKVESPTRKRPDLNTLLDPSERLKPFIPSSLQDRIALRQSSALSQSRGTSLSPRGSSEEIDDPSIPYGAENELSTQEVQYFSFFRRLEDQIGPLWKYHVKRTTFHPPVGDYINRITLKINEKGQILSLSMDQHSLPLFDEAITKTFDEMRIIQNIPKDLLNKGVAEIRYRFTVQVRNSNGVQWYYERE
jgi:hypothetical protein